MLRRLERRLEVSLRLRGWSPYGLSREDVLWAYRLLLEREPENADVVRGKLELFGTLRALREDLLRSPEYARLNPDTAVEAETIVVIREVPRVGRLFLDLADEVISVAILRDRYEPTEAEFFRRSVTDGMTVLDIGANLGFYTVLAGSLVGATGRVIAFEPLLSNRTLLERSVSENGFEDRVTVRDQAVGGARAQMAIVIAEAAANSGGAYISDSAPQGFTSQQVEVIRLDEEDLGGKVDFIKIDIEGAELLAFRGARALLESQRPTIMCELHAKQLRLVSGCSPSDVITQLGAYGYSCHLIAEDGTPGRRITNVPGDVPETVAFVSDKA